MKEGHHILLVIFILAFSKAYGQYTFVGNAVSLGEDCYRITPAVEFQNGALWYNESINLNDPFHLQYEAFFGANPNGADGMVFVMQQVSNNAIGEDGGGMGFSGFQPSFGIEFDTFQNLDFGDPPYDHIAFLSNGIVNHNLPNNLAGPVQASPTSTNIKDGEYHVIDIFWDPEINEVEVWFDCVPRLSATVDLLGNIFTGDPEVFWGLTAATGGFVNNHEVCVDPSILGLEPEYEICQGESVTLQTTGNSSGTYSWEPEDFLSDPSSNAPEATPESTTAYTVTFSDLCGTEQEQSTTVSVIEVALDLGPNIDACLGEPATIVPVTATGSLTWSDGSTEETLTVTEPGIYSAVATAGDCSVEDEIEVNFTDTPELDLPATAEICEGESFSVDLTASGLNITWDDDPDAGAVRELTEAGTYTASGGSGACESTASITLTVNPVPEFDLGESGEFCDSEEVVLTAALGAQTTWNTGAVSPSITVTESGFYEATSVLNGCTFTDAIEIILLSSADPQISGETEFCEGESVELTATGGSNFTWSNGAEGPTVTVSSGGSISVTATDEDTGCPGSATVSLTLGSPPFINMNTELEKCVDESLTISPEVRRADYVLWSTGESLLNITVTEPGIYTLTAGNACGERSANTEVIDDECLQILFAPNAFSPNGDGLNDLYRVHTEGVVRFKMQIFDRWGTMVFETEDANQGWNGSYQNGGYYCEAGVYAVLFELEYEDMNAEVRRGYVTLVR